MKVLIVYAHPEPLSLNGSLKDFAVSVLSEKHEVKVSDLYAMKWKAVADGDDFPQRDPMERLNYAMASKEAFASGTQLPDVIAEQEKLLWADVVILQFPLWWFSMPAIMKGWVDRVYAYGFAYGVGQHGNKRWGDRYGEGTLKGRLAMLVVTAGGRAPQYSVRGVNGSIEDLLFPIHHGILFYPGMDVLPPFVVYQTGSIGPNEYENICQAYKQRLLTLDTTEPIPYRPQNSGDYDEQQVLKPELENGATGLAIHQQTPALNFAPQQIPNKA